MSEVSESDYSGINRGRLVVLDAGVRMHLPAGVEVLRAGPWSDDNIPFGPGDAAGWFGPSDVALVLEERAYGLITWLLVLLPGSGVSGWIPSKWTVEVRP
jgi:hypothetical protein